MVCLLKLDEIMAFKYDKEESSFDLTNPETLFRDLRTGSRITGLLSQQADTLRSYMDHLDDSDLALELPTGGGKTLIGLLIAEWRRRTRRERCIFLCPNRQLVKQVVLQCKTEYGFEVADLSGEFKGIPAGWAP